MWLFIIVLIIMCLLFVGLGVSIKGNDVDGSASVCLFFGALIAVGICVFTWYSSTGLNIDNVVIEEGVTIDEMLEKGIVVLDKNEDGTYTIWELNMNEPKVIELD